MMFRHVTRPHAWLDDGVWRRIESLCSRFDSLSTLNQSIALNVNSWQEWFEAEEPERMPFVDLRRESGVVEVTPFVHALVTLTIRPDRWPAVVNMYVEQVMGPKFRVEESHVVSFEHVYKVSDPGLPVFLRESALGGDAVSVVSRWAAGVPDGVEVFVTSITMDDLKSPFRLLAVVRKCMYAGWWLVVQNAHMAPQLLEAVVEMVQREAASGGGRKQGRVTYANEDGRESSGGGDQSAIVHHISGSPLLSLQKYLHSVARTEIWTSWQGSLVYASGGLGLGGKKGPRSGRMRDDGFSSSSRRRRGRRVGKGGGGGGAGGGGGGSGGGGSGGGSGGGGNGGGEGGGGLRGEAKWLAEVRKLNELGEFKSSMGTGVHLDPGEDVHTGPVSALFRLFVPVRDLEEVGENILASGPVFALGGGGSLKDDMLEVLSWLSEADFLRVRVAHWTPFLFSVAYVTAVFVGRNRYGKVGWASPFSVTWTQFRALLDSLEEIVMEAAGSARMSGGGGVEEESGESEGGGGGGGGEDGEDGEEDGERGRVRFGKSVLEAMKLPWALIRSVIGEALGSGLSAEVDRRVLTVILENVFTKALFEKGYSYDLYDLKVIGEDRKAVYKPVWVTGSHDLHRAAVSEVLLWPEADAPSLYGLTAASLEEMAMERTKRMLTKLRVLYAVNGGVGRGFVGYLKVRDGTRGVYPALSIHLGSKVVGRGVFCSRVPLPLSVQTHVSAKDVIRVMKRIQEAIPLALAHGQLRDRVRALGSGHPYRDFLRQEVVSLEKVVFLVQRMLAILQYGLSCDLLSLFQTQLWNSEPSLYPVVMSVTRSTHPWAGGSFLARGAGKGGSSGGGGGSGSVRSPGRRGGGLGRKFANGRQLLSVAVGSPNTVAARTGLDHVLDLSRKAATGLEWAPLLGTFFEAVHALVLNEVPGSWSNWSWEATSLEEWLGILRARGEQLSMWLKRDRLPMVWLGGLAHPFKFLQALKRKVVRSHPGWTSESTTLHAEFTLRDRELYLSSPPDGVYVHSLVLEGATWSNGKLGDPPSSSIRKKMPVLLISVIPRKDRPRHRLNVFSAPLYYDRGRGERLLWVDLPTDQEVRKWVVRGVALIA